MAAKSRPARWAAAIEEAKKARSEVEDAIAKYAESLQGIEEIRAEYEEWRDNFPENMQSSPTYEKLNEVADLDFSEDTDIEAMNESLEAAESIELPRGFGRD